MSFNHLPLVPCRITSLNDKYEEALNRNPHQELRPWLLYQILSHFLWVESSESQALKLPHLSHPYMFLFFKQWEERDLVRTVEDFSTFHEGIWNAVRNNNCNDAGIIQVVPERLIDWKPTEHFVSFIEAGNFSFPTRSITCPNTRIGLLLEIKNWKFLSASKLAVDGVFGYCNGKLHQLKEM